MDTKKAVLIIVLITFLLLTLSAGCDPVENKVKEAQEGLDQLKRVAGSGKCLTEALNGEISGACPGSNPTPVVSN